MLLPGAALSQGPASITWDGGGDGFSWSDPANWDPDDAPTAGDDVVLTTTVTINIDVPATVRDLILGSATLEGAGGLTIQGLFTFLPYKLNFILETIALEPGRRVQVKTAGDFTGVWTATLSPQAGGTRVDIDWRVTVEKLLIRWLSPLLKLLFAWNHNWTTPRGEAGLRAYLAAQGKSDLEKEHGDLMPSI